MKYHAETYFEQLTMAHLALENLEYPDVLEDEEATHVVVGRWQHHVLDFVKKKKKWANTLTCPILGPLVPLFWISGDVSSGFQSHVFCIVGIVEANAVYVPRDPPLVLHLPIS